MGRYVCGGVHVGVGVDACDLCVRCGADPDEEPTPPVTVEEVLDIDIESEPPATTSDVRRRVLLHNVLCVDEQGLLADTVSVYPKCCPAAQAVIEREVMQLARLLCDTLGPEAILEPFKKFTEPAIRLVREFVSVSSVLVVMPAHSPPLCRVLCARRW